ncbi:malate synthase [Streptomyces catenulae]|uniref:malate synthase n=1 Tax=Streptomyces catenulae TaxID=66875 RepID=A0ABV2YSZ2_9ACTN|nr:malate synthase [Streptomyces catenulae]
MTVSALLPRVRVLAPPDEDHASILTPGALDFVGHLAALFAGRRRDLLRERRRQAQRLTGGAPYGFPLVTSAIRADAGWRVAPPAPGLTDRRVQLTAPPERGTLAAVLASGAQVWTADLADATAPTWHHVIDGQLVLREVTEGRRGPAPTVLVRPRGWHLDEEHLVTEDGPVPAALVDFGLYAYHHARQRSGTGPYFSLAGLENRYEARLWNDVFVAAQDALGLPRGTIRACVSVETVGAAAEMDEILYALRDHSAGLSAAPRGLLFSLVKTFGHRTDFLLPERARVTPGAPFLRAYTELLVRTCHRRGAHAVGATATEVPDADGTLGEAVTARVRLAGEREAEDGFDGTQVAHPALVPVCRAAFDAALGARPHQLDRTREDVAVTAADLLAVRRISAPPTAEGLRGAVAEVVRYYAAWLGGRGTVVRDGALADASVAEVSRAQVWQWLRHRVTDRATVAALLDAELAAVGSAYPWAPLDEVRELFERTASARALPPFFAPVARQLVGQGPERSGSF